MSSAGVKIYNNNTFFKKQKYWKEKNKVVLFAYYMIMCVENPKASTVNYYNY